MTETLPSGDHSPATQQPDLAPTMPVAVMDTPGGGDAKPEGFMHIEPVKRPKTWGEVVFNLGTYGGFGLIGNELASTVITGSVKEGKRFYKPYKAFEEFFTKYKGSRLPEYVTSGRMPYLLVATIGGMLMVLPIKFVEDAKGTIVRKLDHLFHGKKADTDPAMVAAHAEMDEAPKQTWGSLGKGRIVTVASAIGADALFGWGKAPTVGWLKKAGIPDGSLELGSERFAKWLTGVLKVPPEKLVAREKLFANMGWLFTLSTTLTVLFYASSKMFATRSEEKREEKLAKEIVTGELPQTRTAYALDSAEQPTPQDKPTPQVSHITRAEQKIQPEPEPALSA